MKKPTLYIKLEYGHLSSLWADKVPFPRQDKRITTFPDELGLSSELSEKIQLWTRYWLDNFVDVEDIPKGRPQWKAGSNVESWVAQGDSIESALRAELPDFEVFSKWRFYGLNVRFVQ
ncbi:hypothetical protein [Corynebacterium glutamicum]|uniref:hypothetical protein n=1 Tax=Corynebacterium glutamicum TaxID=1718 RepID=UPI001F516979|nr:hypothetical protein [Corynebacterium glutamicum]